MNVRPLAACSRLARWHFGICGRCLSWPGCWSAARTRLTGQRNLQTCRHSVQLSATRIKSCHQHTCGTTFELSGRAHNNTAYPATWCLLFGVALSYSSTPAMCQHALVLMIDLVWGISNLQVLWCARARQSGGNDIPHIPTAPNAMLCCLSGRLLNYRLHGKPVVYNRVFACDPIFTMFPCQRLYFWVVCLQVYDELKSAVF